MRMLGVAPVRDGHSFGMADPLLVLQSLGGIATRQQLVAAGCTGYQLTAAVRSARIRRIRQARYVLADAPQEAIEATRVGGLLAGPSAARSYGLWAGFDARLHISVGANSSRLRTNVPPSFAGRLTPDISRREIVVHWLVGGAVPELGPECWRVPVRTCLRQMVSWSDSETAVACLDTALTSGRVSRGELAALFSDAAASERCIVLSARGGSDSGTESLVRQRLAASGIEVRQQVKIAGVGRIDMAVVGTRVLIEIDSRKYHDDDPAAIEHDRWRDAELAARGYVVVRLSYLKVTTDWPWCLGVVRAAMTQHP